MGNDVRMILDKDSWKVKVEICQVLHKGRLGNWKTKNDQKSDFSSFKGNWYECETKRDFVFQPFWRVSLIHV